MEGEWLPPQAPGTNPPPPVPPGSPPPPAPFEPAPDPVDQQAPAAEPPAPPATQPAAEGPPNNEAVAAMVCAVTAGALLYLSNGLSTLVSLILGIVAVVYVRNAKRNLAAGKTSKHADLTTAAGVAGWISVGVSAVATVAWGLVLVLS